ncbi:DNA helicase PIF1, ATP-dependent [Tanacetum coccineum]|uniref:ATP-dependent DNA helicase n=1 Tax=Tanacetum coccineum TaxID=301880 RepID=A0ABQ4ZBR0_9ASTR
MAPETSTAEPQLFLENLELGLTGTIVLMFCRMWDVYAATGRYLSTDFVVCVNNHILQGTTMHATARSAIAHNFLKLKEGGIYSVKNFAILPNKEEIQVIKNATFMLELDGATTIRKVFMKPNGFIRFPFQLIDFDYLETTNNKYLIDAAGYVTNVGRTVQQKTGSKTLDFRLANSRGQSVRATLWGSLGKLLIEKEPTMLVCRLYLSSTSSTLILDDEEIPELKELKADSSGAKFSKEMPPVGCLEAKAGTLENLLMWSRNQKHDMLELKVSDDTAEVVVVMFNETATSLVKCTTDSIVEYEDRGDAHLPLPQALANVVRTSHTLEFKSHTYYEHNTYESFTCWRIVTAEGMGDSGGSSMAGVSRASETPEFKRLLRHPSVTTPSKVDEGKKHKRVDAEESDAEASFVADTQTPSTMGGSRLDTRKIKRRVVDDNVPRQYQTKEQPVNVNQAMPQKELHLPQEVHLQIIMLFLLQIPSMGPDAYPELYNCILHSITFQHFLTNVNTSDIGAQVSYHNIGAPSYQCVHYNASMWYEERINKGNRAVNPSFSLCCQEGKLWLPKFNPTLEPLHNLLNYNDPATTRFRDQIRVYNSMFSFTSFGARIDHLINNGKGVYTFRVNGQSYHRIGSLLLKEGTQPRYAQLWFFNMENEVRNLMGTFIDKDNSDVVDATTVQSLTQTLDQYSYVAKAFRMAKDWCHLHASVNIELHLLFERTNARQYNKPTVAKVAALITNDFGDGIPSRDIIVNKLHSGPKRISELHQAYMALQYPLLFPYGEDGFHDKIPYYSNRGNRKTNRGFVIMKEYYSYIIHQRNDKVTRGDSNAAGLGQRIVLPGTFVGGPRYMMQNYQDAMALCHDPDGYKAVTNYMLHGPCGKDGRYVPCTTEGKCSMHYPKQYYTNIVLDDDGYPIYRRRDNKASFKKGKFTFDNRHVVPHNRYLLLKYQAHINVEWCNISKSIKYLFKYLNKGLDRETVVIQENVRKGDHLTLEKVVAVDEINNYLNCRYLASYEAVWRFFSFDIHYSYPSVMKLNFHLPNQNPVTLRDSEFLPALLEREGINDTMFTDWFDLNQRDPAARTLTYADLPKLYMWHEQLKIWKPRKQKKCIGRIVYSTPALGERYFLRMLLNVVRGPHDFDELMTQALKLWEETWEFFSEDILHRKRKLYDYPDLQLSIEQIQNYCLLNRNGRSLTDFQDLPRLNPQLLTNMDNRLIREALNFDMNKSRIEHQRLHPLLNPEQRLIYEQDIHSVHNQRGQFYFVYGPGGTGKTFLYNTIIARLWTKRKIVLAVASPGKFYQSYQKEKRPDVVQACINRSELWKHCNIFTLTRSMRVNEYYPNGEIDNQKQEFNQWVLSVGKRTVPAKAKDGEDEPTWIQIPEQHDDEYLKEQAILTPKNDDVDEINNYMFNKLAGKSVTYNSADEICKASRESLDQQQLYPTEFLNALNFSGMSPHALCLKKELPIMLLRNVNPTKGLYN